jgi:hypothetical protein
MRQALQAAHGVVVNSQDTAREIAAFAEREQLRMPPVCVAPLAPALSLVACADSTPPLPCPYFVVLGTVEARKNHALLLRIWRRWRAQAGSSAVPTLVVIGQAGWEAEAVLAELRGANADAALLWLDNADDTTVARYLQHAVALLTPSNAEGYGLPVVEALALGTPVLASDVPAHREAGGVAAQYLVPEDDQAWSSAVQMLAADAAAARGALQECGWQAPTWEQHFARVEAFLREEWLPASRLIVVGFRWWRRVRFLPLLHGLAPGAMKNADGGSVQRADIRFARNVAAAARLQPEVGDTLLCWNRPPWHREMEALAERTGATTLRMEDGFLRSVGLGSNFVRPLSVVFDTRGIYFDPSRPSDLEHLLASRQFTATELAEAKALREFIVANGLTKYNTDPWPIADLPAPEWLSRSAGRKVVLVPGQVEDDASVRLGGGAIQTTAQLLAAVRAMEPDAFIVYRPHPDVMAGNRRGMKSLPSGADAVDALTPLLQLIAMAAEVHVLTSLSGFDALLRGKRVVTYGSPFYAGWGLTLDRGLMAAAAERRSRELALDELIAGALVGYPAYLESSPDMTPSSAENVSCALGAQRQLLVRP